MKRRTATVVTAAVLLVVFTAVATLLPVPYVSLSPGPVFNTIGSYDGKALITITGTKTYPVDGTLDMTTVSERGGPFGGMSLVTAVRGWLNPDVAVVPREVLYPDQKNPDEVQQENAAAFSTSQSDAIAASLGYLKIPVTTEVLVGDVATGSPADGRLDIGDVIVSIDGKVVKKADDVFSAIGSQPVGSQVTFIVVRNSKRTTVQVTTAASKTNASKSYVGITPQASYVGPFDITFGLEDVGGPSAGTMFALGIIDKLTPGQLNNGRSVAGTGTIDPDGKVGPIGGIAQKMVAARDAGASLFLAPAENCNDVVGHIPDGLTVVKIDTLAGAANAVDRWSHAASGVQVALPKC